MIEKIKPETVNVLTDILLTGVEEQAPRPVFEGKTVSRKFCLQTIRIHQQSLKEIDSDGLEEVTVAYQEISDMVDREFELLYQELLTVQV